MLTTFQHELQRILLGCDDDETWAERLVSYRLGKSSELLKLFGNHPAKLGGGLSALAEAVLGCVTERASQKVQARFGIPSYRDNGGQFAVAELAIVAMGKFGARELLPEADLDVLFLYSHWGETRGRTPIGNQEYFARLSQTIMSFLTARSRSGFLYRMDAALRPSGNAGILVTSYDSFIHYHQNEAAAWERLSLIRARPVTGPVAFRQQIETLLTSIVYEPPVPHGLAAELLHLRGRMERELSKETPEKIDIKLGPGGIVDIEFTIQFLQISLGKMYSDLRTTSTFQAIQSLTRRGVLNKEEGRLVEEAYQFYLGVEARIRQQSLASTNVLVRNSLFALETAKALNLESARALTSQLDDLKTKVRALF